MKEKINLGNKVELKVKAGSKDLTNKPSSRVTQEKIKEKIRERLKGFAVIDETMLEVIFKMIIEYENKIKELEKEIKELNELVEDLRGKLADEKYWGKGS